MKYTSEMGSGAMIYIYVCIYVYIYCDVGGSTGSRGHVNSAFS
jgi:hypothetical protein